MTYSLILGSSSIYRQAQLKQLTKNFTVISPNVDETAKQNEAPKELALRLSKDKAIATHSLLAKNLADANNSTNAQIKSAPSEKSKAPTIIICSDQTAALGSQILGKPYTKEAAIKQLSRCSGNSVTFHSAISILTSPFQQSNTASLDNSNNEIHSEVVDTHVTFRKLSQNEIERYIERDDPLQCAGSFKCESLGISLFDSISSNDPSALIGLPLISVSRILRKLGVNVINL